MPRRRPGPEDLPEVVETKQHHLPLGDRDGWATSHLRTVLDCARDLSFAEALAIQSGLDVIPQ